ncbi:hypothetical protein F6X40_11450 [Paraburkholderia sp. UCT31]|uniref:hypothetical protein n=1 Tax=Paraburkholderia sp. UCT31 TaxID=2615209 RepID=UPI00165620E9|nr:hypothetical protein [Paraburkholderia sp. UCT31]MBC8737420.1 hypothetical protein [Paraburkholderia sp. UCT31]
MLQIERDSLKFSFPEVHKDAVCHITFQRTLRIPDDNRTHGLPCGLGAFPLYHVDDYAERLPRAWKEHGGVFLPMAKAEAMWIRFNASFPFAVKIAAGKINAVNGHAWTPGLKRSTHSLLNDHDRLYCGSPSPTSGGVFNANIADWLSSSQKPADPEQDYMVLSKQPWLDGFAVGEGKVRQFVAMPMGEGYTVEEQLTGVAEHGGLQIIVIPLKKEHYTPPRPSPFRGLPGNVTFSGAVGSVMTNTMCSTQAFGALAQNAEMGLGAGGLMKQEIYADDRPIEHWDQASSSRCFVHLLSSDAFEAVTGKQPPPSPVTIDEYRRLGMPFFDYFDANEKALPGSKRLAGVDSIAAKAIKKGETVLPEEQGAGFVAAPVQLKHPRPTGIVREGKF